MNKKMIAMLFIITAISIAGAKNGKIDTAKLSDYQDSISYVLGRDVGSQLRKFGAEVRINQFMDGIETALNNTKSKIDSLKMDSIRQAFASKVQEKVSKDEQALAEQNKKKSDDFLLQNKKKPGVETTKSGLQYKVIDKGKGPKPSATDSVSVLYKGMFMDNTVFDSTTSNQPVTLNLQRTIPGLAEGLQLMNEGGHFLFYVPPELGYGPQGATPVIPPNTLLIFDVTLNKVLSKK